MKLKASLSDLFARASAFDPGGRLTGLTYDELVRNRQRPEVQRYVRLHDLPPIAFAHLISRSIGLTQGFGLPQLSQPNSGRASSSTR